MEKRIADIISKTVTGLALSENESAILDKWLNESEKNRLEYELITGISYSVKTPDLENNKSLILSRVNARIYTGQKFIRNLWIASASVAAIALTFFIGRFSADINSPEIGNKIVYNEINVPQGAKSQLTLSDGTKVWLNGGSKLRYPTHFVSESREVQLDGEAYFDVAHNKSKPFFVNTGSILIKVLGTAFNVKSYSEDKTVETTLVRGLVEIREIKGKTLTAPVLMKPNQKAILVKGEGSLTVNPARKEEEELKELPDKLPAISVNKVNIVPITSWIEQELVFDNITFEEMATTLARWYGVKVNIEDNTLRKYKYKGRFSHNETIYQVLEVIKVTTPIQYEVKNYEINIGLKKATEY